MDDDIHGEKDAAFQKGQQVEQYKIVEIIASTRFGHMYLGRHLHQSGQVLIEGLQPPLLGKYAEAFLMGARMLKEMAHPSILPVRDVGVHQDYPYLVMDYFPYRLLSQVYAENRPWPLLTVLPYLQKIALALDYAHSQYVVHGDVRPENILLTANDTPLLRGFLLEAHVQNRAGLHYVGSEEVERRAMIYAAPEQIQGDPGAASDQYALAALIY